MFASSSTGPRHYVKNGGRAGTKISNWRGTHIKRAIDEAALQRNFPLIHQTIHAKGGHNRSSKYWFCMPTCSITVQGITNTWWQWGTFILGEQDILVFIPTTQLSHWMSSSSVQTTKLWRTFSVAQALHISGQMTNITTSVRPLPMSAGDMC